MSKTSKQSVDTTLPQAIYNWVSTREKVYNIMTVDLGRTSELPQLIKIMKTAESRIKSVKDRIKNKKIILTDVEYVEEKYNDLVKGVDNRPKAGLSKGNAKNLPFIKADGTPFTANDITDAMKGGTFPTGFYANRMTNKNSVEFKNILAEITPNQGRADETRKTEILSELRKDDNPVGKTKEQMIKDKTAKAKAKKDAEDKIEEDKKSKEAQDLLDSVVLSEDEAEDGIGGEKDGETVKLEDVAEDEGLKGEPPVGPRPAPDAETQPPPEDSEQNREDTDAEKQKEQDTQPPPEDAEEIREEQPPPADLPDNRGAIDEAPDILDASRGGVGMTPSGIVKGGGSSDKEDSQRNKMNIARLKEEIRALHLIYDNNIEKFRSNPHQGDKEDALKSDKVEVVRKHHKDMEISIREYYRSGGGDTLQVGVIVPIDTYLQQYLSGGKPNEMSIPQVSSRTIGKEGTTSVGLGHRDGDLKSKKHDPYSRAIAQGIYYQRGGMGSYKQRGVSGHTIKIGGKDKIGDIKDPSTRVDAVMDNYLNRAVKELPNPSLKLKTK